ncbi:MAG TPA: type VI immunity family protein, partial [Polyangiaceae bacterium]|nr:type VI immunity family protein [Polyangiaceae bacterium]
APLSFFKVTVPVDVDLEAFAALFDALRKVLRIRWGNAGYTYSSWEVLERYAGARAIYAHARRYCGFDVGQSVRQLERFCDAIRTVNWLTAAGPELTAKLEAVRPVGLDASNLITVLRDEHGLLVRAGQTPQIGDVNRLEFPPPYAASDRLLRPIRATQANFLGRWDERSTEAWLSRFERSST